MGLPWANPADPRGLPFDAATDTTSRLSCFDAYRIDQATDRPLVRRRFCLVCGGDGRCGCGVIVAFLVFGVVAADFGLCLTRGRGAEPALTGITGRGLLGK